MAAGGNAETNLESVESRMASIYYTEVQDGGLGPNSSR